MTEPRSVCKVLASPPLSDPFRFPQLVLFELDDEQWLKVRQRPYDRQPERSTPQVTQLSLKNFKIAV
jgi:hypothetical protein